VWKLDSKKRGSIRGRKGGGEGHKSNRKVSSMWIGFREGGGEKNERRIAVTGRR